MSDAVHFPIARRRSITTPNFQVDEVGTGVHEPVVIDQAVNILSGARRLDMNEQGVGRVFLLKCPGSLDGNGITPEEVVQQTVKAGAKFLIVDATDASFVDTPGVRWLLRLRSLLEAMGKGLRIAARSKGSVSRNLQILEVNIDCYDSVATAWRTPWQNMSRRPKSTRKQAA